MILKKVYFPKSNKISKQVSICISVFKLSQQYYIIEKVLVLSIFVGKIKLNFYYKKMSECITICRRNIKIVFSKILKIYKAFSNFDFDSTIREKTLIFAIVWK